MSIRDEMRNDVGEKLPAVKLDPMGAWKKGTLLDVPKKIEFDQDGSAKKCWIVKVEHEGEPHTLWLDKPALLAAVLDACDSSADGKFTVGDEIAVRWSGERDTGKPSKLKEFEAAYKPAPKSVSTADAFGEDPF